MYVLNIATILVDAGGKKVRYSRGNDVSQVDPDQLASMVRLGQAVEHDPTQAVEVEEVIAPTASASESPIDAPKPDWRMTPVGQLDLESGIVQILSDAGLGTVLAVLEYGATNNGSLVSISGIGKGREEAIQTAIQKVAGE